MQQMESSNRCSCWSIRNRSISKSLQRSVEMKGLRGFCWIQKHFVTQCC